MAEDPTPSDAADGHHCRYCPKNRKSSIVLCPFCPPEKDLWLCEKHYQPHMVTCHQGLQKKAGNNPKR